MEECKMRFPDIPKMIKERFATSGLGPSHRIEVLNLLLELGKWLEDNKFEVRFKSRYEMYDYINNEIVKNGAIDYLEFGVWYGRSIKYWAQLNRDLNSRFFGFDTFEGLPEDWKVFTQVLPKGTFSAEGKIPEIDDQRVKFIKGYFQATLPDFLKNFTVNNQLIINCDADLYTSTLYVLASLNQLMTPGTIVIFDEFSIVNEFRAFRDFTQSFMRNYRLLATAERFYLRVAMEFA
jgi:O-methyltransferase